MPPSTRWCPTPEQLRILEGIYRSGTKTPTAPLIQRITAQLSRYGKIEGKNVFYWFQNHKARDRLKLRRCLHRHHQLVLLQQQQQLFGCCPSLQPISPAYFFLQEVREEEQCAAMDLLRKLDGRAAEGEWHPSALVGACADASPGRPARTLDLFPTRSTGLKEECGRPDSSSSSSSCSTSVTN